MLDERDPPDGKPVPAPGIPPVLIGLLLLLTVVLAVIFLVAANVVQTP